VAKLISYPWPGNVRELGSVLYRSAAMARGDVVELHDIEAALPRTLHKRTALTADEATRTLESYDGNISAAARAARVPRSTFRSWLPKQVG
jgi:transcriptional regulator of acetoin/glycerol metabolism